MALTVEAAGQDVTLINIYGPSSKSKARELLFSSLGECERPRGAILMGGDFNCTLDDELDRSRLSSQAHDSPALHALLEQWQLVDVLATEMDEVATVADKIDFQTAHHTYRYQWSDGSLASSRLDRWYISSAFADRVTSVTVDPPANFSDHDAVSIRYAVLPTRGVVGRRRRPRLRYPLPFGCRQSVTQLTTTAVDAFVQDAVSDGALSAQAWVNLKNQVRREALVCVRVNLRRQKRSLRRRRKRLSSALRAALFAARPEQRHRTADIQTVTEGMAELTLAPYEKVASLRRSIIRLDRRRARARRRTTFAVHSAGTPEAERAFFQRFNVRKGQRTSVTLPPETGAERATADRLADDWKSVTQIGATEATAREDFFSRLPVLPPSPLLQSLDDEFTENEVRAALHACPRGKAPGPDGLPNDWYRDHEDLLVPVLTPLFNHWHRQRTLPASFRLATVACIPKTATPKTGLDFRPIALLDTDYKIYSRLLLSRVVPVLPALVAPTQFGFVTGRQVHDALEVFHGIQELVRRGDAPDGTIAILLDFAKAYDTLDRAFLLRALERLGFPRRFCAAVVQMHLHTVAEYAADDGISTPQAVLNGIRQGCPLFVLAVNTLYEAIDNDEDIHGVQLPGGHHVCATGYADDTTCYLAGSASVLPLRSALDRFGAAAGLRVNVQKCVAVRLGQSSENVPEFPTAGPLEPSRLLGGHVATDDVAGKIWSITLQQVRARLYWAELKTTNETQRVKLLRAVFLPKFLFVARHLWPTASTIDKFQRLVDKFVWTGSLAAEGPRKRAWMSQHVARAGITHGGLAVPHLTHELQVMSLKTVESWARPPTGVQGAIRQILLQTSAARDGLLAPSRLAEPARPILRASLAATGIQLRQALANTPRTADEIALAEPLHALVGRGSSADYHWENGWLVANYGRAEPSLTVLRQYQAAAYGNLQVDALLSSRVVGEDILLRRQGLPVTVADFPGILRSTDRLRDVVEVAWYAAGTIGFRSTRHDWPLEPAVTGPFRRLCDTIVFNYPGILRPPAQPEDLILRPPSLDGWTLQHQPDGLAVEWTPVESAKIRLGTVRTTAEATTLARRFLRDPHVAFERHNWLDAPYALWVGVAEPTPAAARDLLASDRVSHCVAEQEARARRWARADSTIAASLESVDWVKLMQTPGAPASHRLLFHKLKGDRLTGWDRLNDRRGCPHCPALGGDGGSAFHIAWGCRHASARWEQLRDFWAPLYENLPRLHDGHLKTDIFSLQLAVLPDALWSHPELTRLGEPTARDTTATTLALQSVWRRQVLVTLSEIWKRRTAPDSSADLWSDREAQARHGASLHAVLHGLRWDRAPDSAATKFTAAALDVLFGSQGLPSSPAPASSPSAADSYVLFFDGGSRGNPGPGGAGAVIIRVDGGRTRASVIWSAAMSLREARTTNNQAEYLGLLTGLKAARRNAWAPLEVVGDSQLILRQMAHYRPPKNARLLQCYAEARRIADTLRVRAWHHHYRASNKMADAAANVAMDAAASSQVHHPTTRSEHASIAAFLPSDFAQWQVVQFSS